MKKQLLVYISALVFIVAACAKKNEEPQPVTSVPDGDGYDIVSIVPANGKVGDEVVITTNQIQDVARVTIHGLRASISTIENEKITVTIPQYATSGKVKLEVRDKALEAESKDDFVVEYPANQLAFVGGDTRYGASGFAIGTKIYMGLGFRGQDDFWEYDTQTNAWKQLANFPGGKRGFAVSFVIDGKGYMGTGRLYNTSANTSTWYKDFWQYDPATDQWTKKADFAGSARTEAVGFAINGKGYIGTGLDERGNQNDMWEYNPTIDRWTQMADLTDDNFFGLSRKQAVCFVINNKAYIGTGNTDRKDFWEFTPTATDQWRKVADFGGVGRGSALAFTISGKGYVGTGYTESGYKNDMWQYDPATDQWTKKTDFSGGQRIWAIGFAIGNKAYIGTGWGLNNYTSSYSPMRDFWQYTP
ncbi:Kelch repeat-containing protein [Microscilla marina]|uniref:Putative exported protein n=1 Tax=Microscilla marina ATCC 23134 TaxID=313606 RepID=A1ZQA3_MICM2|nr:kelch repeat-containing protein [Microscilla marina]EAY27512.1 putative exported protein [Microscilla marina ATCC 23134]